MKFKRLKVMIAVICVIAAGAGSWKIYSDYGRNQDGTDLLIENVEALSGGTEASGAKCPNGCKNIGWGLNKILECDCNYDHLSCCDSWGC